MTKPGDPTVTVHVDTDRLADIVKAHIRDVIAPLIGLVREFIDPHGCQYDHDGNCQAHSLHAAPCPHERAKRLLADMEAAHAAPTAEGEATP